MNEKQPKENGNQENQDFIEKLKSSPQESLERVGQTLNQIKEGVLSTLHTAMQKKATDIFKEDHQKVRGMIKKLKGAPEEKEALLGAIQEEIDVHTECEEQIFYPEVRKIDSELVAESLEEHHQVRTILAELQEMTGREGEGFEAKVTVLEEMLEHHMEEEEEEMFPEAEDKLKDQLKDLGREIEYFKGELKANRRAA